MLIGPAVFVIEFKVGSSEFAAAGREQVWDYALDLKNFYRSSHQAPIIPILVATEAASTPLAPLVPDDDRVFRPIDSSAAQLSEALAQALAMLPCQPALDAATWADSPYWPTPTIVEAARALYSQHSVEAIARSDAGAKNLHRTAARLRELAAGAQREGKKAMGFVTGVPGAGKTLVGLDLATRRGDDVERSDSSHAVYLSGNGPLVSVLREALARDELQRLKEHGDAAKKNQARQSIKSFIQNVHNFRDEALVPERPPFEHVVVFDEAQRAWNQAKTADFMKRRKKRPNFPYSEAEFLVMYLDRHKDWAFIVCLVGGGQEIYRGEAGIGEWLDAINRRFPAWDVHLSSRLADSEYAAQAELEAIRNRPNTFDEPDLHLAVSMRSFRAENVSEFVRCLLDCEREGARVGCRDLYGRYPLALTRNLDSAKRWLRARARGSDRFGMLASSRAQRLKPHAIDVRVEVNPIHWFLNGRHDTRSSYYLEDAATEFQVQGLELDWACVTWDGDLRFDGEGWSHHNFRGSRWQRVWNDADRRYLRNAYRVLLTRARQGMVIFVPPGDASDPTRNPQFYDATFSYLAGLGLPVVS
ncbi:MAG TPA: DUF2075 domain-containing protein [Terriglobales bacterium]|nr:DUF2075 domain-containing protein [Terriglobales bacterium]